MSKLSRDELTWRQSQPLDVKVLMSKERVRSWYEHWQGNVYVSFSGGKDSTVLLYLVRSVYPDVPAVFIDTGLEYPEIKTFVQSIDNVITVRPRKSYRQIITEYGYPIVSKEVAQKIKEIRNTKSQKLRNKRLHGDTKGNGRLSRKWQYLIDAPFLISDHCCAVLKKNPAKQYERSTGRKPFIGLMACDSSMRTVSYLRQGCNSFKTKRPVSHPLGFWLETDVWKYIKTMNIPYSPIYDLGYTRTGCMWCMFGVHKDTTPNRFQHMANTHPKIYNYCIDKMGLGRVLDFLDVDY